MICMKNIGEMDFEGRHDNKEGFGAPWKSSSIEVATSYAIMS